MSEEELRTFHDAFKQFDHNDDGHINTSVGKLKLHHQKISQTDCQELANVMRSLGQNPTESELIDLINEVKIQS